MTKKNEGVTCDCLNKEINANGEGWGFKLSHMVFNNKDQA